MSEVTVYFDGDCHLCSREINHYRKKDSLQRIEFVDIAELNFSAEQHGLDPVFVQQHLHVRLANGDLQTGVNAFIAIWNVLPAYQWMSRLINLPIIRPLANVAYSIFAKIRPYLPKRKRNLCENNSCTM